LLLWALPTIFLLFPSKPLSRQPPNIARIANKCDLLWSLSQRGFYYLSRSLGEKGINANEGKQRKEKKESNAES
jgi:hypothetical protein